MGIQPIDLQNMYSQMNNVAKVVSNQQQGSQLTQAMQESLRKLTKVLNKKERNSTLMEMQPLIVT